MATAAPWRPGLAIGGKTTALPYFQRSLANALLPVLRPSLGVARHAQQKPGHTAGLQSSRVQRGIVKVSAAAAAGVYEESLGSVVRRRLQHVLFSPLDKEIWAVALPALVAMLVEPVMNALNAGLVGHLGTQQLSAVSLGNLAVSLCTFFYTFLLFLTVPEIAAAVVQKKDDEVSCIAAKSLWLAAVCGVLSAAAMFWGAGGIIKLLNPPEAAVAAYAVDYIRIRSLGVPAVLLGFVATGVFRGFKDTRTPMLGALVSAGASLGLNVLFLYVLQMGVTGAAAATTAAQAVSCGLLLTALLRGGRIQARHLARPPPLAAMLPTIKLGAVLGARNMVTFGMVIYASALSIRIGSTNQASFEIIRQFWILTIQFFECLNVAAQALCASYLGKEDRLTARALLNRLCVLGVGIGALAGGAVWAAHQPLVTFFTRDPLVVAQVVATLPMICLFFPLDAAASIMDGSLLAAKQSNYMSAVQIAGSVLQYFVLSYIATGGHVSTLTVWSALKILVVTRVITGFARNYFSTKSAYDVRHVPAPGTPAAGPAVADGAKPSIAAATAEPPTAGVAATTTPAGAPAEQERLAAAVAPVSEALPAGATLQRPAITVLVGAATAGAAAGARGAAGPSSLPISLQSIEDDVMVLACAACTSATDMNADMLSLKRRQQQPQQQQPEAAQQGQAALGHGGGDSAGATAPAGADGAADGEQVASTSGRDGDGNGAAVGGDGDGFGGDGAGLGAFAGTGVAPPGGVRVVNVRVVLGNGSHGSAAVGGRGDGPAGSADGDGTGAGMGSGSSSSAAVETSEAPVLVQVVGAKGQVAKAAVAAAAAAAVVGSGASSQLPSHGSPR